jgi:hypothetical protein
MNPSMMRILNVRSVSLFDSTDQYMTTELLKMVTLSSPFNYFTHQVEHFFHSNSIAAAFDPLDWPMWVLQSNTETSFVIFFPLCTDTSHLCDMWGSSSFSSYCAMSQLYVPWKMAELFSPLHFWLSLRKEYYFCWHVVRCQHNLSPSISENLENYKNCSSSM